MVRSRRQDQLMAGGSQSSPNRDFLHINGWFSIVARQPREVEHRQSLQRRSPQLAVAGNGQIGEAETAFCRQQPVGRAEAHEIWRRVLFMLPSLKRIRPTSGTSVAADP